MLRDSVLSSRLQTRNKEMTCGWPFSVSGLVGKLFLNTHHMKLSPIHNDTATSRHTIRSSVILAVSNREMVQKCVRVLVEIREYQYIVRNITLGQNQAH